MTTTNINVEITFFGQKNKNKRYATTEEPDAVIPLSKCHLHDPIQRRKDTIASDVIAKSQILSGFLYM